ncbi:autotransporter outer membrane beta-barrel domain-containing protein [Sphingomonas trueperi]|uniref:Autotransporter-associated beta strand protein n=1 Tax=Sphingomonas trueperi TaxID=53317 RepID=A0A7X5XW44_9SPHN|nr:autotransporter outer membrane beta-barrel domain-containing protein [Sphingomonas trueperi]NJB96457.1 autotransporter-associated beta strand protein [Sphingomonas trueperi]
MQKIVEGARTQGVVAQKVRGVRGILAASTMLGMPVAAAALGLLAPAAAQAQSTILAGDYIKVGINGSIGSLGYDGNTSPGILYDGSGSGTFNTAYDYLTPGSPFEGFVVTANGLAPIVNNNGQGAAFTGSLTSYNGVAYGGTTYDQRAVWTGTYGSLFTITNDYFFNKTSQQVGIRTTITALSDLTDLAFSRALDPDAVAAAGDSSMTNNFRGNGTVSVNDLVYAEALVSKYAIGLYTNSAYTHNSAVTGWTTDTASYLAGTDVGNGDNTIGLGFSLGSLLAGNSAVIDYSYIFGTDIGKALASAGGGRGNIATDVTAGDVVAGNVNPVLSGGKITFGADQTLGNDLTIDPAGGTIDTTTANATLAGVISGAGGLTKTGTGTLTLTGANSYTGGTTVAAGRLVGDTGSLTGSIVNDGAVEFAQGSDGSFGGAVTGTGALIKSGTGTLTLTGANSYTGGTTVAAGKLVGDTGSLTGSIVNDGVVEFAQGGTGSFGGTVTGTGALIKSGTGTLTLTGANSYTGGTTVEAGKLVGDTSSLQGTIVNNATVEFAQATAGTFAGTLAGTGSLVKSGAGTLTLAGTAQRLTLDVTQGKVIATSQAAIGSDGGAIKLENAGTLAAGANLTITQAVLVGNGGGVIDTGASTVRLTGGSMGGNCLIKQGSGLLVLASDASNAIGACVEQGTMSFDSTFAGNVFVDAVGTARGNGTVQGNMQVSGTLAPGNSPGRLVVAGSVTQAAGSTLSIDVDGTTAGVGAGHYDTLVLTGATSVYTAAGTLAPKLRGITGDATNSFTPTVGQTFEIVTAEGGVTGSFDALTQPSAGLAANTRFDVIYGSKAILLAVTPDSYARYLATGAGSNAVAAATALDAARPAAGVRTAGTTGALFANLATLSGGAIGTSFQQLAGGLHADAIEAQFQANQALRDTMVQRVRSRGGVAGEGARKTGLWGAFNAQRIDVDADATGNGYRATSYGYTLGVDHQATNTLVLGLAASYKDVDTRATALGTAKVKGYGGALYAVWNKGPDYVTGVIDFNVDDYTVRRNVQLGGGVEALKGDGKGFSFGADIEAGHRFDLGALGVTPVAGIAYDRVERNAFGETGGSAALRFDGEGRTGWTGRAGVRVDGAVGSMVRPFVSAMAVQQLGDNRTSLQARLVGARIDTRSVSVGDTQLRAEAGLSANLTGGVSVDLRYRYTGLGHADAHSGNAAISLRF